MNLSLVRFQINEFYTFYPAKVDFWFMDSYSYIPIGILDNNLFIFIIVTIRLYLNTFISCICGIYIIIMHKIMYVYIL